MTFGNSMINFIKNSNTPRGQSFNISRRSVCNPNVAAPTENMGTLLQSIKEAEEQLEILKGESN